MKYSWEMMSNVFRQLHNESLPDYLGNGVSSVDVKSGSRKLVHRILKSLQGREHTIEIELA